ncbi:MAG: glycoside hydrolase family 108 protein [Qingshengfaniella sp.]
MSPLIGIAVNLLPELAKRLAPGSSTATRDLVVKIVQDVLKTDDPQQAAQRAQDAAMSAELRIRLAEIEADAQASDRKAEAQARQAQTEMLKAEVEAAAAKNANELRAIEARLQDRQDARSTMVTLQKEDSPLAWGPVIVSCIVVFGFFATLLYLIYLLRNPSADGTDNAVVQIVNIAVGALTAGFATVVSFWLGSSDTSRQKDSNALKTQNAVAQIQRDNVQATREIISEQSKHTAELVEKVTRQVAAPVAVPAPAVASERSNKDALQFQECMKLIFKYEGGFVDHPNDPGGATNLGITHKTLAAWRGVASVNKDEVRALSREEAEEIYRANYWNALSCDQLPAGLDLVVFDFGVNAGVGRSAKLLQKVIHVEQDGQIGPITLGAARQIETRYVIETFSEGRMDHYRSLHHWDTFKNGWTRRTDEIRAAAMNMA